MRIGFYAGNCIPVHAYSLDERPLGGIETGLIRLTEELSRRKHEVVVFTSYKTPPQSNPIYKYHQEILVDYKFDVMVFVKEWAPAFYGLSFPKTYFWTGDGWDQYANFGLGDLRVVNKLDRFLAVSKWHAKTMSEQSGFPIEKTEVIGNGVNLAYFEGSEERKRKRIVYASAPYRGLELIPPIFVELKKKHPESELHVFAGMNVYDTDKPYQGPERELEKKLGQLLKSIPGVHVHGNVLQKQLARELMRSSILFYPNTVFETCCIVALEAQAAGCPVVTNNISALPETVGECGVLLDAQNLGKQDYLLQCYRVLDELLSNDEKWQRLSQLSLEKAKQEFSWEKVADRFEAVMSL
jgi:glycosyltransferase involved in cell wall biosynthesis